MPALPPPTTHPDFQDALRAWKESTGATLDELAALLPVGRATIARWLTGQQPPTGPAAAKWDALASGQMPRQLRDDARKILEQADRIEDFFREKP